ncbi:MAG TPA: hypothetical protein EYO59_12835, partial [Chromatiaceae bacterium]|nr:hypothetical protein [Chromatiaceae bacterium]
MQCRSMPARQVTRPGVPQQIESEVASCSICLDPVGEDDFVMRECLKPHPHHQACIQNWLATLRASDPWAHIICPVCRVEGKRSTAEIPDPRTCAAKLLGGAKFWLSGGARGASAQIIEMEFNA